jgi:hypothetical protein
MEFTPLNINSWLKTYFIGAMSQTQANDAGFGWRETLTKEFVKRLDVNGNPVYIFNPCLEEQSKVGLNPKEFHAQIKQWVKEGKKEEVGKSSKLIWFGKTIIESKRGTFQLKHLPGDFDYVENSDFLICKIEPLDKPAGTYFEAGYSMKLGIPIYVLQTQPIENYSESFIGWVYGSGGDFFETQEKLLKYIDKTYKLEVK